MDWTLKRCSLLRTTKRSVIFWTPRLLLLRCVVLPRYRLDMINWSTKIREQDYTYFCKAAVNKYQAERSSSVRKIFKRKVQFCVQICCVDCE